MHTDPVTQREWLSAWLDNELSAEEHATLARHLDGCAACREELAELRDVRGLLRALPTPPLPRSFALPLEGPLPATSRVDPFAMAPTVTPTSAQVPAPLLSSGRSVARTRSAGWPAVARRVGGAAAMVGVAVLLGSAVVAATHLGQPHFSPAAESSAATTRPGPSTPNTASAHSAPSGSATRLPANVPRQGLGTHAPVSGQSVAGASDPLLPLVPLAGAGLAGGGSLLFVAGTRGRRRE